MKRIWILILAIIIVSCNSENSPEIIPEYNIQKYYFRYMDYPDGISVSLNSENSIQIEYDNNFKIIKRIGGYREMDPSSGFFYALDDQIYDQVTQNNNEILIEQKISATNFSIPKFERKLFLNNQNRIIKKTIFREFPSFSNPERDTIIYNYDSNGKIAESIGGKPSNYNEKVKFYFNQFNNLDSIVSKKYFQTNLESKTIEKFSNYDSANNPLKKFIIFEETFNRSLSENNYKKYEKKIYNQNNELIYESTKVWNLIYDSNGNVKFESK